MVGALTQISREHGSATGALVLTWGNGGDQLGHREIVAEELRGLVRQNQPPAGARREEATRASDGGGAETGEGQPTARVGGRAEPNQTYHEPPPRIRTPGCDSVVFLDEVTRVMRARHAFGVLGDVVVHATPSRGRVERLYQQAVTRLGHTGQKRKQAGRPPCTNEQVAEAGERLRKARAELLNDVFREEEHARIRREGRPVTRRVRCPIDIGALEAYAVSAAGARVIRRDRHFFANQTHHDVVRAFLQRVRPGPDPRTGFVDIEFEHGRRTDAMVAAGWLSGGGNTLQLPRRTPSGSRDPSEAPRWRALASTSTTEPHMRGRPSR